MDLITVGQSIRAVMLMKCLNVKLMTTEEIKEELLWLKGFDTDWSKEISCLLKKELSIRDIQALPKEHTES